MPRIARCSISLGAACVALAGCGGADIEVAPTAVRQPGRRIEGAALQKPLQVPAQEPFNIHVPSSEQRGQGQAHATAEASGTAQCKASSAGAGMAVARFQLGHKFEIAGMRETRAVVRVNVKGRVSHSRSDDDPDTSDSADLLVFVKDTRGAVLAKESLVMLEGRPSAGEFQRVTQFDVKLFGDTGYYVVFSGRASASASAATRAAAELLIESAAVEVAAARTPATMSAEPTSTAPAGE